MFEVDVKNMRGGKVREGEKGPVQVWNVDENDGPFLS